MSKDSITVLSGSLQINGQQHNNQSEMRLCGGMKVKIVVYKISNRHFAVVYPIVDLIGANHHICCLNLKTCNIDVRPGVVTHDIQINTNSDFDGGLQLVLTIEAKSHNLNKLYANLRPDNQEINGLFGQMVRKKCVSRQTSLEKVDELE